MTVNSDAKFARYLEETDGWLKSHKVVLGSSCPPLNQAIDNIAEIKNLPEVLDRAYVKSSQEEVLFNKSLSPPSSPLPSPKITAGSDAKFARYLEETDGWLKSHKVVLGNSCPPLNQAIDNIAEMKKLPEFLDSAYVNSSSNESSSLLPSTKATTGGDVLYRGLRSKS